VICSAVLSGFFNVSVFVLNMVKLILNNNVQSSYIVFAE